MSPHGMRIASDAPRLLLGLIRVIDVVLVIASGVLSFAIRHDTFELPDYYVVGILTGSVLTANMMQIGGAYTLSALQQLGVELGKLSAAWLGVSLVLIVFAFFTKTSDEFSRVWLVTWIAIAFSTMTLARIFAYWQLLRWRRAGILRIKVAIVGTGTLAARLLQTLDARASGEFQVVGVYDDRLTSQEPAPTASRIGRHELRGTITELVRHFRERPVDEIIIALPWRDNERIAEILKSLKALPANVRLCPDTLGFELPTRGFVTVADVPMMSIFERPLSGWHIVAKALEDRVLAAVALLLAAPLMLFIALAIKLDSQGPVLFGQRRYGFNNNEFLVYKFRTMRVDACGADDTRQATRNDPRVTLVGAFLRRTSLDELPQLFNVLKGDMSLVGPRPHAIAHNEQFATMIDDYLSRHRVKPGITGWAQINGLRGEIDSPRKMQLRVQHDLYYIDNWSLLLDLKILLLTPFLGFVHKNAY